ncbi:MAG: DUF2442 domain-containing protein [Campylobacterales bacterium]|nr:DUF2442 domain-containing protein [Campylobacterales bacterium]
MIKLQKIEPLEGYTLRLTFSDGSFGTMDFAYLLDYKSRLTEPLADLGYFRSCFIDFGALCWKNALELSAESLHQTLKERGLLEYDERSVA